MRLFLFFAVLFSSFEPSFSINDENLILTTPDSSYAGVPSGGHPSGGHPSSEQSSGVACGKGVFYTNGTWNMSAMSAQKSNSKCTFTIADVKNKCKVTLGEPEVATQQGVCSTHSSGDLQCSCSGAFCNFDVANMLKIDALKERAKECKFTGVNATRIPKFNTFYNNPSLQCLIGKKSENFKEDSVFKYHGGSWRTLNETEAAEGDMCQLKVRRDCRVELSAVKIEASLDFSKANIMCYPHTEGSFICNCVTGDFCHLDFLKFLPQLYQITDNLDQCEWDEFPTWLSYKYGQDPIVTTTPSPEAPGSEVTVPDQNSLTATASLFVAFVVAVFGRF